MTYQQLIDKIRQLREEKGLTGREIATKAGIDEGELSRYFSAKKTMRTDTLLRICEALDVKLAFESLKN